MAIPAFEKDTIFADQTFLGDHLQCQNLAARGDFRGIIGLIRCMDGSRGYARGGAYDYISDFQKPERNDEILRYIFRQQSGYQGRAQIILKNQAITADIARDKSEYRPGFEDSVSGGIDLFSKELLALERCLMLLETVPEAKLQELDPEMFRRLGCLRKARADSIQYRAILGQLDANLGDLA